MLSTVFSARPLKLFVGRGSGVAVSVAPVSTASKLPGLLVSRYAASFSRYDHVVAISPGASTPATAGRSTFGARSSAARRLASMSSGLALLPVISTLAGAGAAVTRAGSMRWPVPAVRSYSRSTAPPSGTAGPRPRVWVAPTAKALSAVTTQSSAATSKVARSSGAPGALPCRSCQDVLPTPTCIGSHSPAMTAQFSLVGSTRASPGLSPEACSSENSTVRSPAFSVTFRIAWNTRTTGSRMNG